MFTIRLLNAANIVMGESTVDEADLLDEIESFKEEMTTGWTIDIIKLGER